MLKRIGNTTFFGILSGPYNSWVPLWDECFFSNQNSSPGPKVILYFRSSVVFCNTFCVLVLGEYGHKSGCIAPRGSWPMCWPILTKNIKPGLTSNRSCLAINPINPLKLEYVKDSAPLPLSCPYPGTKYHIDKYKCSVVSSCNHMPVSYYFSVF